MLETEMDFSTAVEASLTRPDQFWGELAEDLHWDRRWDRVLDDRAAPMYRWFTGGRLNTCYNAVDVHVEQGRGDQAAVIHDSQPFLPSTSRRNSNSSRSKGRARMTDSAAAEVQATATHPRFPA